MSTDELRREQVGGPRVVTYAICTAVCVLALLAAWGVA